MAPASCAEFGLLVVGDELGEGAGHLAGAGVAAELEPGEALGAEFLGFFGEGVDLLCGSATVPPPGTQMVLTRPPASTADLKTPASVALAPVGDVLEFEAVADVGAVDAEAVHGFLVGHALEGGGEFDVEDFLPEADDEAGDEGDDVLAVDEGHFDIELGEFGLAVGAEVLIAEAAGDLHVAFQAADHEDLLEELRATAAGRRSCRVEARGDEEFAGAFGGGLVEDGGFDFEEAVLVAVVAHDLGDLVAGDHGVGQFLAAQVEVAVLEARVLADGFALAGGEGDGVGLVDEFGLGDDDFDLAGGQLGVGLALLAGADLAAGRQTTSSLRRARPISWASL